MAAARRPAMSPASSPPSEELLFLWTEKLYEEHAGLAWQYKVKLPRPVIRIAELQRDWGSWDPLTRTLTLARRLIEGYRWDVVLEILKHEMAHQMVTDVLGGDTAPHGPIFARACEAMRVADWARTATGALPEVLPTEPTFRRAPLTDRPEDDRLLRRVEKLLSLAASSNEHEALLAMQRVQELYARHHLSRLRELAEARAAGRAGAENGAGGRGGAVVLALHLGRKRVDRLDSMICSILNEHFFVRVIHGKLFDAHELCDYRTADLVGSRENVLMAEYVFHFLRGQIAALWEEFRVRTRAAGNTRQDYMLGLLSGFRGKLSEEKELIVRAADRSLSRSECRALVALGEREIEECLQRVHPRLTTRRWSASYRDASSYSAGVAQGRNIVIHKGVGGDRGNRGRLLTRS
jgi:hypothetical protein